MAEYIERTEELVLAMNAGARACEHTWRHHSAVYTKNLLSDNSQEISYLLAAKVLLKVSDAPAADVAPVRHGKWMPFHAEFAGDIQYCSICEIGFADRTSYCPHCGAVMDGWRVEGKEND